MTSVAFLPPGTREEFHVALAVWVPTNKVTLNYHEHLDLLAERVIGLLEKEEDLEFAYELIDQTFERERMLDTGYHYPCREAPWKYVMDLIVDNPLLGDRLGLMTEQEEDDLIDGRRWKVIPSTEAKEILDEDSLEIWLDSFTLLPRF